MNTVASGAHISGDGVYRYGLWRHWGPGPSLSFVMLNPSTADAALDDPTIRRCTGFARTLGHDGINVVNLYAFRATNPAELRTAVDPHGPENEAWLRGRLEAARHGATTIVVAWGAWLPDDHAAPTFRNLAREVGVTLRCLGRTKEGQPRHPLYLKGDSPLTEWS